jgi:hypothetical protein
VPPIERDGEIILKLAMQLKKYVKQNPQEQNKGNERGSISL